MFLRILSLCFLTVPLWAGEPLSGVTPGVYKLIEGKQQGDLCDPSEITLSSDELTGPYLVLSQNYVFQLLNEESTRQSDMEPECDEVFSNKVIRSDDETNFHRRLTEVCKVKGVKKTTSSTLSYLQLKQDTLTLTVTLDNASPYTCKWKKIK